MTEKEIERLAMEAFNKLGRAHPTLHLDENGGVPESWQPPT